LAANGSQLPEKARFFVGLSMTNLGGGRLLKIIIENRWRLTAGSIKVPGAFVAADPASFSRIALIIEMNLVILCI